MSDSGFESEKEQVGIDAGVVLGAVLRNLVRIVFVTVLLCAAAYAVLLFVPKVYESRAELLVEPRINSGAAAGSSGADAYLIDAAAVSSQIELIKSRDTIRTAIENLDLAEDPAFEGQSLDRIIAAISDDLVVTQERGSRLISIAYRAQDPDLAARIANGIAQAHVNRRAGQQISDTIETTGWLHDEIGRLRTTVLEAERAIANFRVDNDLFVGANNESLTNQQLSNFSTQIASVAERRSAAQSRAQLIRALLESGQSVIGLSDVQASSVGQQLSQELARLQGERAQQASTFLPNHPTIRALDAQIAEINSRVAAEGRSIAAALEAQAQIEADLQESMQAELDRLKVTAGANTMEGVTLAELEREATAQRELLNAYLLRYAEATARSDVSSALPDVRIVSEAAPSVRPAAPQTVMIVAGLAVVSVLLQVGAVIFSELLSGRALVGRDVEREMNAEATSDVAEPEAETAEPETAETLIEDEAQVLAVEAHEEIEQPVAEAASEVPTDEAGPVERIGFDADVDIEALAAIVAAGTARVLVLASVDAVFDCQEFAERLSAKLIRNGLSVAEIDAASGLQGNEAGLSDLCAGQAEFGDVVHRAPDGQFAYVPWGQASRLGRTGGRAATLVEALADIYECVLVVTGPIEMKSSLPLFADVGARCILLAASRADAFPIEHEIVALGFETVQVVALDDASAKVA